MGVFSKVFDTIKNKFTNTAERQGSQVTNTKTDKAEKKVARKHHKVIPKHGHSGRMAAIHELHRHHFGTFSPPASLTAYMVRRPSKGRRRKQQEWLAKERKKDHALNYRVRKSAVLPSTQPVRPSERLGQTIRFKDILANEG